ncbi:transcription regulator protein BACH1-like [Phyllopteryx taeniolatus]|uniref:transcription regulator protein BACH1-like n=1 Tax=Phyllopteryx taeniolatus TaxID=161469 RepID=UPI002AD3137A|nr:transcription regulator protein BACH1-like [Phyllopteryx taeniolatus]XP_061636990.1 transcription regulator protein BACH1-like [Phyllopteryx taeniolatus]XP_061636991.1 transcription regulator protein BACH1-like [Phyllopteryx taeniolatus]XP_061636992.1 transcription regulator protein BACH1-like [Phyllopteryx taeniolatus]XP_061636993.1 transcription regulator protein BACH1-like [Phyllopteryx taeniolatus]
MQLQAQRASVFTFQSAVHSAHVLRCLDEQRRRDVLCDVTVVVEGRGFRAHAAVLASCSEYFHGRVAAADSKLNAVVALPDEVTVQGFEALLQFAYTSKLLFTKANIHEIQSCAKFLGFRNLEAACFDFLIPKFSERKAQDVKPKVCCQGREERLRSSDLRTDLPPLFPPVAPPPTRDLCLETCGPQMPSLSLDLSANVVCPMLSLPDPDEAGRASRMCAEDILAVEDVCGPSQLGLPELPCELSAAEHVDPRDLIEPGESLDVDCGLASCPGAEGCAQLFEKSGKDEGFSERSREEREVAEHLAKGFWSVLCTPSQPQTLPPLDQNNLEKAPSDFHWLKQLDLTSNPADCPFLRELDAGDEPKSRTDTLSQSEKSPCISSVNSAEDSDMDTDGDSEANSRRAAEIQLPFPVENISTLSRSAFQQLLKHHPMTPEQLEFVHDVRRRSKNRAAAQRCRKRKMDSIHHLDCEIKTLKSEKDKLLHERAELEQNLEETRQSLCRLCKSVSAEPTSEQDHLHFLAKLSAPEFPVSPHLADKDA